MISRWPRSIAGALTAGVLALAGVTAGGTTPAGSSRLRTPRPRHNRRARHASRARHAARGLVPGRITAVGDSVMLDYAGALEHDVRNVQVHATVGEQWYTGVSVVRSLRARHELGTRAVVGLGTNGPITTADFDAMRRALRGVRRVVFVTVHVDRPWQGEVNAVIRAGVKAMPSARLASWYRLSAPHPSWFYADGTHLPIDGTGARALAALVTRTLDAPAHPGHG